MTAMTTYSIEDDDADHDDASARTLNLLVEMLRTWMCALARPLGNVALAHAIVH